MMQNRNSRIGLFVLSICTLLSLSLASCSDDEALNDSSMAIKPAKTPDFRVYSGGAVLGSTFTTRALTRADVQVNVNFFKIQDFGGGKSEWMQSAYPILYQYFDNAPERTDREEQVSQAEYDFVMEYIKNHPDEGGKECNLTTYFIQNVGSSYDNYKVDYINGGTVHHSDDVTGGNYMDFVQLSSSHISDYNAHWGPRALCVDIPVVDPTYHDSWGYEESTKENAYKFYYITYNGKTNCYLCFDYRTKKYDNGQLDFQGDGVYNDWVIKLIPADGSDVVAPAVTPEPDDTDPTIGEIEVNLSVNDAKVEGDYIATKLSIHVRDTADVDVFMPIPAEYYCEADDMDIVLSHRFEVEMHGASATHMTYNVNGHDIELTVTYSIEGIHVTTAGINAEVLRYLRTTYGDGITFEVWNYYRDTITREQLKPLLDNSTVTFTADPGRYINAFAKRDGAKNVWDCIVTPPSSFGTGIANDGEHDYNVIYTK